MSKQFHIGMTTGGKAFNLPADLVGQTQAIIAVKGGGKTYTGMVMMEEMLRANAQVVALDPTGVWWGLRADGKESGIPVLVMGGDHGNVPLEPTAGEIVADFIVDSRRSAVLDLSAFESNAAQDRFVTAFAERLYRRKAANREPLHLMVDEADSFAPQRPMPGQQRMLGAWEAIVRRGRSRGLGLTMITQRPAVLNKNVLTQAELLTCLRIVGPQDQKAIMEWVNLHSTPEQRSTFLETLASLPKGTAWFWSPGWLGCFEQVRIREKLTFDSSKTPDAGSGTARPKGEAAVDLEGLTEQIKASVEKAKANDPKEIPKLHRRIAELEQAAKGKAAPVTVADPKAIERALVERDRHWTTQLAAVTRNCDALASRLSRIAALCHLNGDAPGPVVMPPTHHVRDAAKMVSSPRPAPARREPVDPDSKLPDGERKILTACAQYPDGLQRQQLTILSGYKRSTRDAYIARLIPRGFVEVSGDTVRATDAGIAALGNFEPLPTGAYLLDYWRGKLPEGERAILDVLVAAYPKPVDREALSEATGYKRSTRDAYISRLIPKQIVKSVGRGEVTAADELFT